MILLFHIAIALTGLAYATYLYISPAQSKFKIAYGLTGLTLASGFYLVWSTKTAILSACLSGLFYLAAVSFCIARAHRKLAMLQSKE